MKLFIVCLLVGASLADEAIKAKWSSFKAQHGKEYHPSAEAQRMEAYLDNSRFIDEHNARFQRGEVNFELKHNEHSDLAAHEFRGKMLGKKSMSLKGHNITLVPSITMPSLPESVDWRTSGIVTDPKSQGQCGSCYAFGTMGVIESAIAKKTGQKLDLSEQQVVDCSSNGGCGGGHEVTTMNYVKTNGINSESAYPYISGPTKQRYACKSNSGPNAKGLSYLGVDPGNEQKLAEAVAKYGTMVMSISGENRAFQFFGGGRIFDDPACKKQVDHVISVIGYGTEGGRPYWLIKNSWGKTWADGGFAKVLRGVNQCGVVSDYSWTISV